MASTLIAISLLLLVALGIAVFFFAGTNSRDANVDDPEPRGDDR